MQTETNPNPQHFDLATDIGRSQVFGLIGSQCTAAHAVCMRQIRDTQAYRETGLSWEDFCPKYLGIPRRTVDRIIDNLEELGTAYFQLSSVVRISAERYRDLAPKIEDGKIEVSGEMVPIAPENAGRIRQAVPRKRPPQPGPPSLEILESRSDKLIQHLQANAGQARVESDDTALERLVEIIDRIAARLQDLRTEVTSW